MVPCSLSLGPCPGWIDLRRVGCLVADKVRVKRIDERSIVVADIADTGPDGMVHDGAGGRGPQQRAHLLDVLVGRIEPEIEGGGIENDGHPS